MAKIAREFAARTRARKRALQALYQWQITAQTATEILDQFLVEQDLSKVDVPYFEALVRDVITQSDALDDSLEPHLDRPIERVDPLERAVLRIAALELAERAHIPGRVVINEAVDLTHTFGATQAHEFVNAVVDGLAKATRPQEFA